MRDRDDEDEEGYDSDTEESDNEYDSEEDDNSNEDYYTDNGTDNGSYDDSEGSDESSEVDEEDGSNDNQTGTQRRARTRTSRLSDASDASATEFKEQFELMFPDKSFHELDWGEREEIVISKETEKEIQREKNKSTKKNRFSSAVFRTDIKCQ